MTIVKQLQVPRTQIGESPVWDERQRRLEWIDVVGKKLFSADVDGADLQSKSWEDYPACFALRPNAGKLIAFRRSIRLFDAGGEEEQRLTMSDFDVAKERFNEGACDSRGRLWVGTLDRYVKQPVGGLFRIDPDLSSRRMVEGITLANGIAWSPDERTMYHCDSGPRTVYAYDYDIATGEVGERRVFVTFGEYEGMPDGCAMDVEGHLWVAAPGAAAILRFAPDGTRAGKIDLPTREPTSLVFGGDGLETMFVTSMISHEAKAQNESDGGLFAVRASVAGVPRHRFGA